MKSYGFLVVFFGIGLMFQPLSAQTWGTEKRLTWNAGNSSHPSVATDSSDHIHVVWDDDISGNFEIYYKKSTDGGNTWTTKRLTTNPRDSFYPVIATDASCMNTIKIEWWHIIPVGHEITHC